MLTFPFLRDTPDDLIREVVRRLAPRDLAEDLAGATRETLERVLFSLCGFQVLHEKAVRRIMAQGLSPSTLRSVAEELGVKGSGKPFDVALRVANVPWRVSGKAVGVFSEVFSIDLEFLPQAGDRKDHVEYVEPFSPPPELFDYQREIADEIRDFIIGGGGTALMQLPTGAGKTRTAMDGIASALSQLPSGASKGVLWFAHTQELCEQAHESFIKTWRDVGSYEVRVARFWGEYRAPVEEMLGSVNICGFQKAVSLRRRAPDEFERLARKTSVAIVDEAHKALAPTIRALVSDLMRLNVTVLGLSATPGRSASDDSENIALADLFGKRLIVTTRLGDDPIRELQERGVLAMVERETLTTKCRCLLSRGERNAAVEYSDLPQSVLSRLAENKGRNDIICETVAAECTTGGPSLVFACSVDHSRFLSSKLAILGFRTSAIDCHMRRAQRMRVIQSFRRGEIDALFNFGVLSTGFDAPNVRTVVIARPTSSIVLYSQMIGRGMRGVLVGGEQVCKLIDIRDNFENFGEVGEVYEYFSQFWGAD